MTDVRHGDHPSRRERYPRGEGDRLRLDLLDAAADLMAETGDIEQVSLRAIAHRAGVSPTAVYRHFDDHMSLLTDAVAYCWAEFEAALGAAFDGPDAPIDPTERLRACGDAYVRFAGEQTGKYHVLFSNKIDIGDAFERNVGDSAFEMLVRLVDDVLHANGDDRDAVFVAVQVHTWIHGIVDLTCRHPDFEWPPVPVLLDEMLPRLDLVTTS